MYYYVHTYHICQLFKIIWHWLLAAVLQFHLQLFEQANQKVKTAPKFLEEILYLYIDDTNLMI